MVPTRVFSSVILSLGFLATQVVQAQILPVLPMPSTQPLGEVEQAGGAIAAEELTNEVEQTGWPAITMPKVTMPTITMPKLAMPDLTKVLGPVKSGFQKLSSGSKKAWEGTKEMFSFGGDDKLPSQATTRTTAPKKPFWKKLLGRTPAPTVPQTVGDFMSQPRVGE